VHFAKHTCSISWRSMPIACSVGIGVLGVWRSAWGGANFCPLLNNLRGSLIFLTMAMEGMDDAQSHLVASSLDEAVLNEPTTAVTTSQPSASTSGSSKGHKRPKRPDAHEWRPEYPPREYTRFLRLVALEYYRLRSHQAFQRQFFRNGEDGYVDLSKDLCREFLDKLDASEVFNNYSDYWLHTEWLN
jgi:hypothetical protein